MHRTTRVLGLFAVVVATAVPVTACGEAAVPPAVCVPELAVSPEDPRPGRIVTVIPERACPVPEGTVWTLRIQPAGARVPLAQARAHPEPDGSFSVEITVPPTIAPGPAIVSITNYWETVECPSAGASCASAEGRFTVAP